MASFAADHVIGDLAAFERAVAAGRGGRPRRLAGHHRHPSRRGRPRRSATSARAPRCPGTTGAYVVEEFVEKPSAEVARAYVAAGDYRWNAGMFVVRPGVLLDLLGRPAPGLRRRLSRDLAADPDRLEEVWPTLPRIAIDHAVAEPAAADGPGRDGAGRVRLGRHRRLPLAGRRARRRPRRATCRSWATPTCRAEAASGLVVPGGGRLVAVVGLDDVVVVDTPDAAAGHDPRTRPGRQGAGRPAPRRPVAPT